MEVYFSEEELELDCVGRYDPRGIKYGSHGGENYCFGPVESLTLCQVLREELGSSVGFTLSFLSEEHFRLECESVQYWIPFVS